MLRHHMEFHLGALLFLVSPCLCVNGRGVLRLLARLRPERRSERDRDFALGELVSMVRGEPTNEEWRYIFSEPSREPCELEVVNELSEECVFCWVDEQGGLHGFHPIDNGSIRDGSVSNRHSESTFAGHCFIGIRRSIKIPRSLQEVRRADLIFLYKLTRGGNRHILRLTRSFAGVRAILDSEALPASDDKIDNSDKVYLLTDICGFRVHYEPGVFEACPLFKKAFEEDLQYVSF